MSLKDLFKRKTPLQRATKELCEPYAQPEYRREAMTKLLAMKTEDAYDALLRRFTFNASGNIADEDEKRDLVEELVQVGEPVVPSLRRFIKKEKAVAFPIRILGRIHSRQETLRFLMEALSGMEPLDHRTIEQKRGIIQSLTDLEAREHAAQLLPYLGDHSDDVQYQVIDALERLGLESAEALAKVCIGEDHGPRIQRRAAQALETLKLSVKDHFDQFNPALRAEYVIGRKGALVKKSAAAEEN